MATLRRYLVRRFLIAILGAFLICSLLVFMIDFVELLRQSGKHGRAPIGRLLLLGLLRLPAYTEFLLGFAVLVGSLAALLLLARRSELAVMRAAGMSVWQFLRPALVTAFALGVLTVGIYNPLAAAARTEAEQLFAETFGRESNFLRGQGSGTWLRQEGADGQSVLSAAAASEQGMVLREVTAFVFDRDGRFLERVEGRTARLEEGHWAIEGATVTEIGREPEEYGRYLLSTHLSPERVQDALGTVLSQSFWELPGLIEVAEKSGLSASRLRIQHELLLSRPLLLMVMVLLAATVSLRSFRGGGTQTMVVLGMVGGVGFFLLSEVSRQIGVAGLVSPRVAIWVPALVGMFVTLTVLLHQEDG
jgi:lipopolysaccharide export system permease protein